MPFPNFGGSKGKRKKHNRKIGTRIRIRNRNRIHSGLGSGSTFSKGGSEDPDPDPLFPKGGSEDPDPLYPNVDPRIRIRIRIHVKIRWIRNPGSNFFYFDEISKIRPLELKNTYFWPFSENKAKMVVFWL